MRKIIAVLILLLTLNTASNGAESEDMSVYVRKDVFEVYMQNMNAKLDMILEEQKAQREEQKLQRQAINELTKAVAVLSERTDRNFETLSARIDGVSIRIDDLRNGLYLWLVVIGTFIAWPKAKEFIQTRKANKRYLTLEDVKRLIEENNAKLSRSSQG